MFTPKRKALGSNPDGCAIEKSLIYLDKSGLFLYFVINLFLDLFSFFGVFGTDSGTNAFYFAQFSMYCLIFCPSVLHTKCHRYMVLKVSFASSILSMHKPPFSPFFQPETRRFSSYYSLFRKLLSGRPWAYIPMGAPDKMPRSEHDRGIFICSKKQSRLCLEAGLFGSVMSFPYYFIIFSGRCILLKLQKTGGPKPPVLLD